MGSKTRHNVTYQPTGDIPRTLSCPGLSGLFNKYNMKTCVTCKQSKPLSEYHRHCTNKDGHQAMCKLCNVIYQRAYRKHCLQDDTLRARYNTRYKRYALRHPERIKAKKAISNAIHRKKLNRPETLHCMNCFEQAEEYHHPSYAPEQRFSIVPVCADCHKEIHINQRLLA